MSVELKSSCMHSIAMVQMNWIFRISLDLSKIEMISWLWLANYPLHTRRSTSYITSARRRIQRGFGTPRYQVYRFELNWLPTRLDRKQPAGRGGEREIGCKNQVDRHGSTSRFRWLQSPKPWLGWVSLALAWTDPELLHVGYVILWQGC